MGLQRFTADGDKGGKAANDRVETATNSYIAPIAPAGRRARFGEV